MTASLAPVAPPHCEMLETALSGYVVVFRTLRRLAIQAYIMNDSSLKVGSPQTTNPVYSRVYGSLMLVLNLGHSPLYRHFCKCLYIELLKFRLLFNYWHIANPILSGRILKKSLQPLNILVKNLPRYSHADRPCIFTVLMML